MPGVPSWGQLWRDARTVGKAWWWAKSPRPIGRPGVPFPPSFGRTGPPGSEQLDPTRGPIIDFATDLAREFGLLPDRERKRRRRRARAVGGRGGGGPVGIGDLVRVQTDPLFPQEGGPPLAIKADTLR